MQNDEKDVVVRLPVYQRHIDYRMYRRRKILFIVNPHDRFSLCLNFEHLDTTT